MTRINKPLRTIISSAFQGEILEELERIEQKMRELGPAPKFDITRPDSYDERNRHIKALDELLSKARIVACKALPSSVMTAFSEIISLEISYYLGKKESENEN